jgi:hypothetical protein
MSTPETAGSRAAADDAARDGGATPRVPPARRWWSADGRGPWLALLGAGILAIATAIPAPFTIDDNHHMVSAFAAARGGFTVAGTEGLPPSRELLWFDPAAHVREVETTPVAHTLPPLYGWLAAPFTAGGWRGLVALNVVGLLLAATALRKLAAQGGSLAGPAWGAVAVFLAGSFVWEYAQGVWAHCLAVGLTTGGVAAAVGAARRWGSDVAGSALAAGLLLGMAAGVRYQNVVLAGAVGLGLLLLSRERWRAAVYFAAGAAVPLAASSCLNALRHGSWNPISKGGSYLRPTTGGDAGSPVWDALHTAWFMVVDHATRPPLRNPTLQGWWVRDESSGVWLVSGAVKKALLQSTPWAALALVALAVAWWRDPLPQSSRLPRRLFALAAAVTIAAFAVAGSRRTDGLCFNQRYLLELMPLLAAALVWSLDGLRGGRRSWLYGGLAGAVCAYGLLFGLPVGDGRLWALRLVPLALAAALVVAWGLWQRARRRGGMPGAGVGAGVGADGGDGAGGGAGADGGRAATATAALTAAALAWSLLVHLGEDVAASRGHRSRNHENAQALAAALPPRAALLADWGEGVDAAGPLWLDSGRDLVVVDVARDRGTTAGELIAALQAQGRPIFVFGRLEPETAAAVLDGRRWEAVPIASYERLLRLEGGSATWLGRRRAP